MLRGITAGFCLVLASAPALAHKGHRDLTCRAYAGTFVQIATKGGHPFEVYRTGPPSARIGVLLLPGKGGLSAATLAWADRIGAQGYRVVAVNPSHDAKGGGARLSVHGRRARKERAAIRFLSAPGRKVVTFGWGHVGARESLEASAADPHDVSGTVLYDGGVSAKAAILRRLQSEVLLVAFNQTTPLAKLQAFEARMRLYGKPLITHYYNINPQAANPSGPNYDSAIAQAVWRQTRIFFQRVSTLCRRCAYYPSGLFNYHN